MWWGCVLQSGITHSLLPGSLFNQTLHKHGKSWCWHMLCTASMDVLLHLFPCQKHCHQPEMCSSTAEWFCSRDLTLSLLCACSSCQCLCIKSSIRPSGRTRWHSWQKRNRCRCISSPGSGLSLYSTNWLFATDVFCNDDGFWAGGSDTCALGHSQLNKLL